MPRSRLLQPLVAFIPRCLYSARQPRLSVRRKDLRDRSAVDALKYVLVAIHSFQLISVVVEREVKAGDQFLGGLICYWLAEGNFEEGLKIVIWWWFFILGIGFHMGEDSPHEFALVLTLAFLQQLHRLVNFVTGAFNQGYNWRGQDKGYILLGTQSFLTFRYSQNLISGFYWILAFGSRLLWGIFELILAHTPSLHKSCLTSFVNVAYTCFLLFLNYVQSVRRERSVLIRIEIAGLYTIDRMNQCSRLEFRPGFNSGRCPQINIAAVKYKTKYMAGRDPQNAAVVGRHRGLGLPEPLDFNFIRGNPGAQVLRNNPSMLVVEFLRASQMGASSAVLLRLCRCLLTEITRLLQVSRQLTD